MARPTPPLLLAGGALIACASSLLLTSTPIHAQSNRPIPERIRNAATQPLPTGALDGTGGASWASRVNAIHSDGERFDAAWRRGSPTAAVGTVAVGRNVLVVEDVDGTIRDASFGGVSGNEALSALSNELYSMYPDTYDFVQILLNWTDNSVAAYYLPLSNDVRGIGTKRLPPFREVYDDTEGELQGYIFMNDWRGYLGQNAVYGRIVFLQEIGHRWGSFVFFDKGDGPSDALLGRDQAHWSYFVHSHNSALEGNDWRDNGDGSFSTLTSGFRMTFSPLDRYLMGAIPAEEVEPFFYIGNPDTGDLRDSRGARLNPASGPEIDGSIRTINGDLVEVTIEDIIEAEGGRVPYHRLAQKTWRMATILVIKQGETLSDERLELVDTLIDDWRMLFEEEVDFGLDLITSLDGMEEATDVGFGRPCVSTNQCDVTTSTTCLEVPGATGEEAQVCSHRCIEDEECGAGFCCLDPGETGALFCYPSDEPCPVEEVVEPDPIEGAGDPGVSVNNDDGGDGGDDDDDGGDLIEDDGAGGAPEPVQIGGGGGCACETSPAEAPAAAATGLLAFVFVLVGGVVMRRR